MPHPGSFTSRKHPVPLVYKAGWAPGLVWTGAENNAYTGIRSTDRPARSKSLYRLSYPDPLLIKCVYIYIYIYIYILFVLSRSLYCLCVYMCTVLLPPGGYPIAVKYISYHILSYSIISYRIVSYRILLYHII